MMNSNAASTVGPPQNVNHNLEEGLLEDPNPSLAGRTVRWFRNSMPSSDGAFQGLGQKVICHTSTFLVGMLTSAIMVRNINHGNTCNNVGEYIEIGTGVTLGIIGLAAASFAYGRRSPN